MRVHPPIPTALKGRPFTVQEAADLGISRAVLSGSRFQRLVDGVYAEASLARTHPVMLAAGQLVVAPDAAVSHTSALRLYGVPIGIASPLHYSTNLPAQTRRNQIVEHRRQGDLHPRFVDAIPALGPDRTFVDCATMLGLVDLVRAGDWLIRLAVTDLGTLHDYVNQSHLNGVRLARHALGYVRENVASIRETDVRIIIVLAGLPEPAVNLNILDRYGRFIARGDLVYVRFKVLVEYDGWQHERDAWQRQRDRERREQLEADGWRVIVVTSADLARPNDVVWRVYEALKLRGYDGNRPVVRN